MDIKPGEEITTNYIGGFVFLGMRKKEIRQKIIFESEGFTCVCDKCKNEKDNAKDSYQSKIEEMIREVKKLQKGRNDWIHQHQKNVSPILLIYMNYHSALREF